MFLEKMWLTVLPWGIFSALAPSLWHNHISPPCRACLTSACEQVKHHFGQKLYEPVLSATTSL